MDTLFSVLLLSLLLCCLLMYTFVVLLLRGRFIGCYFIVVNVVVTHFISSFLLPSIIHSFILFSFFFNFHSFRFVSAQNVGLSEKICILFCLFSRLFISVCVFSCSFASDKLNCKWNSGTHTHTYAHKEREGKNRPDAVSTRQDKPLYSMIHAFELIWRIRTAYQLSGLVLIIITIAAQHSHSQHVR